MWPGVSSPNPLEDTSNSSAQAGDRGAGQLGTIRISLWRRDMVLLSAMIDPVGQGDPQTGLGQFAWALRKKQEPTRHLVLAISRWANVRCGMGERDRQTERFMSSGQRHIWRGERGEELTEVSVLIATQGDGYVWAWVATAGRQLRSVLLSMAPDTVKGQGDRAVQDWLHPSVNAMLGRTGAAPH